MKKHFLSGSVCLFILLTIVLVSGCVRKYASLKKQWKFREYIRATGSRRQRSIGVLTFRDRLIPVGLSAIVCPSGSFFRHKNSRFLASAMGWVPEDGSTTSFAVRETPQLFLRTDRKRGFYRAGLMQKKKGTPPHWIWVRFKGQGYWMRPAGVFYYITIIK